ncbi:MAG: Ig-like domain-containing protein [Chloroflexi bacterium]|nr:Ig-like domain-containing protein [Chloroflexota bacterium]
MLRQNCLRIPIAFLTILILFSNFDQGVVTAAPLILSTPIITTTATPTIPFTPTWTPTSIIQSEADPQAWLDGTIDANQFSPKGTLVIHFNTPMSTDSTPNPILTWPAVIGVNSWDATNTILTFTPSSNLVSEKTYTFFLDSALHSAAGKQLADAPEWIVRVGSGPKIQSITPKAGSLARHYGSIEVSFDRKMNLSSSKEIFSIEPPVPFELKWKNDRTLQIIVQQPLETGQHYDLTLNGGNNDSSLLAADGSYLAEDYRWFYWQAPFEVHAEVLGSKTLGVKFNYLLDPSKSVLPISISPSLEGEWKWYSSQEIRFTAKDTIPAFREYTLSLSNPLVDSTGLEISALPTISFSGLAPIRLANRNINKSKYDGNLYADSNLDTIRIEFSVPVDHASAEKAFSLTPKTAGKFLWEKNASNSKEILVYALGELLKPSSTYTVKVDTTVGNTEGKGIIIQPYQQSFVINQWGFITPSFGEAGDNIQVLDANGTRQLQFSGEGSEISFTAYRFDLIDFAGLYADHYHSRNYEYGNNVRDIPIPSGSKPAAVWSNVSSREAGDGKIVETTIPVELSPGLYVVNLRNKNILYDQIFLVVTRNTLVVKNDGDDLFIWLTNINGKNVPDAEIRVYSTSGEKIREGRTDENGQYRVSIPDDAEPLLVSARIQEVGAAGDVTLAGFNDWSSQFPYSYQDYANILPEGQPYLVYLYTERPIYRPGQTVNFKAIVRKDNDLRYTLPLAGSPVKVRVLDARGNAIENMDLAINRFGTVNGAINISEGAMLGQYQIEADIDGVITSQPFQVEDYRKPDYQIRITSLQPEKDGNFVRGEEIRVRINTAYYFGEPLANTNLEVKFYSLYPLNTKISGSLVTDENGDATISFPAPYDINSDNIYYGWGYGANYQSVRMEVTANDGSNQTVAGVYHFSVYPASEQLGLDTEGYFVQPDQSFTITANVVDLFDHPVTGRKLILTTHSWNRNTFEFDPVKNTLELQTDANGNARQNIKLSAGYYKLTLSGEDVEGHKIEVSRGVYVFKSKQDWFARSQSEFLMISAEKDSYKPYDIARLAIESTFSGPALLTFERGSVINTKMVELTAPLTIIETEVIPEHAPNVYVTVNAWQAASPDVHRDQYGYYMQTEADSYLRLAKTQIQVDASSKALDISIVTDKQTYTPGEKMKTVIQVKDADGKPVLAEVSLAVVDEAIYGLASDTSSNIFDAFYGPRGHSVRTSDSMAPTRFLQVGGQGGGGDTPPAAARSEFLDTSAWLPVIETDSNGKAVVTIDLPDNTTSWRLSAKAITLSHQVGQTSVNIETKKEVFVRPILPRILTNGDQATLTAFIHNYSTQTQKISVNLFAPGLEIRSQNNEEFTLRPGDVLPVGWQVRVQSAKPTEVTITAKNAAGILDIIRVPLPLQPSTIKDVQNQSGQFSGTLTLALPLPNVERETSEVRLTLNRSMSGTLLSGLEYLTGYPYGCVEQTMSKALPNAVVGRVAEKLGIGDPEMKARLDPLIKASIQRLYGLQHSDGGWGWWTDDISDPYQTAWVLFGLDLMDNSGYSIEPKVMDEAALWLRNEMDRNPDLDIRTQAYALYSMAQSGRGDIAKTEALVSDSIYELDPFSQASLALALNHMDKKEKAKEILNILSQSALKEDEYINWPQPSYDGEYHSKTMASTIRTTALALLAYAEIEPQNPLIPGIVNYLADQRQGIYGWGTTNETSFTILALTEYLVTEETKLGNTTYEVLVNGKSLATDILEVGKSSANLDIPLEQLKGGINTLVVKSQGENPLYFDLSTRYDLLRSNVEAAGNIQVMRRFLDPKTKASIESFQAGQLIKVELHVHIPENAFFLAVEDYLPGGFEALNEGLSATSQVSNNFWGYENYTPFYWEDYGYNYKEIRGDRVVFFITSFEKGTRTFSYFARATTPGQFIALPAQAYAMYDFSLWGRSDSVNIQITK